MSSNDDNPAHDDLASAMFYLRRFHRRHNTPLPIKLVMVYNKAEECFRAESAFKHDIAKDPTFMPIHDSFNVGYLLQGVTFTFDFQKPKY